jgi:predicted acetyltransferase
MDDTLKSGSPETLQLTKPTAEHEASYRSFLKEFQDRNEPLIPAVLETAAPTFAALLERLDKDDRGIDLPEGFVPATMYWLINRDNEIVAIGHLRHRLTPALEFCGGHIGYGVRPSQRGKGYASELLHRMLQVCKSMGIEQVLMTCDKRNKASARVITKNGGIFDKEYPDTTNPERVTQRYWIDLFG